MPINNSRRKGDNYLASFQLPTRLYETCKLRMRAFGFRSFSAYIRACIVAEMRANPIESGTYGHPAQACIPDDRQLSLWDE